MNKDEVPKSVRDWYGKIGKTVQRRTSKPPIEAINPRVGDRLPFAQVPV
jgi:hypothetical protein